jgi:hypothetical protein
VSSPDRAVPPSPPRSRVPRSVLVLTLAAVALRLLLLLGRGHYVAFDEGWYLILGRNLWHGEGYSLSGLRHVALSPLFPILAGALDRVLHDAMWSGRIVAALAAGLLVVPSWFIFRRLAGERTAAVGAGLVAFLPSLAPFVVPYWIGWDLWVGAEPLLHLLLFSGIALFLRTWTNGGLGAPAACGAAFALAYLARPEAVVTFGLLGALAVGLVLLRRGGGGPEGRTTPTRSSRMLARAVVCAAAFLMVATPYWIYLRGTTGEWMITGRAVRLPTPRTGPIRTSDAPPNRIEDMLWRGDASPYIRSLYSLNPSATALANGYWGVSRTEVDRAGDQDGETRSAPGGTNPTTGPERDPELASASTDADAGEATSRDEAPGPVTDADGPRSIQGDAAGEVVQTRTTPWLLRYARALGVAMPWYLWLFAIPGLAMPGRERHPDLEALIGLPLVATSVLIARVVAIDPRTQLFIVPLAALYAARGLLVVADAVGSRLAERVRREVVTAVFLGLVALDLLGTSAVRLGMSLSVGSPHHVVAAENAAVGAAIRDATPDDATVMSFHPAVALFADRDWRVLPLEPLDRIIRYARTQPDPYLVLSVFYPPEVRPLEEPHYLIVPVPPDLPDSDRWRIEVPRPGTVMAFGELEPME